jgi:hypothetical protein
MRKSTHECAVLAGAFLLLTGTWAEGATTAPPPVVAPIHQPQAHPIPVPDVPQAQPGVYLRGLPTYAPLPSVREGQFSPPPAPSPVTNYGPGGIAPIPGAPANPPYSTGGVAH